MMAFYRKLADLSITLLPAGASESLRSTLHFFVYEILYILTLVVVISWIMGFIRPLVPVAKIRTWLAHPVYKWLGYPLASIFGAVTPFCSCSSTPLFIGFLEARIPLGVTFSFLITSPLVNEIALALFIGTFGLKVGLLYAFAGIVIGILGGVLIGKLRLESWVADFIWSINRRTAAVTEERFSWRERLALANQEAVTITKKIAPFVMAGIAVGSLIYGYVPDNFFQATLNESSWWNVPAGTLVGIPLYASASTIVPVLQTLVAKGVPLGTAMAFAMAAVGLSTPEAIILKKVMSVKLLVTFFAIVAAGIICVGFLFNFVNV
jgi:uncharacterized membrane protein YraQ (UPF0718 family)